MKSQKLIASVLGLSIMATSLSAQATDEVVDEKWGEPTFVYGDSLDEAQITETKGSLGIQNTKLNMATITGQDMVNFLGSGNENAKMYSSALIEANDSKDDSLVVQIVTPDNITKVSVTQYQNALITAGATNVSVKVASPIKVTGESALTGIYKAYAVNDITLDKDRMKVAQQELSTVTDIVENTKNKEFNEEALNKAVIDIKEGLKDLTDDGNEQVARDTVETMVNRKLESNGLSEYITPEQVSALVDFAMAYAKTGAVSSDAVTSQLSQLTDDVKSNVSERAKEIGSNLKDKVSDEGLWESVKTFFIKIGDVIAGIFK